jgi:hypothetical protein
VIAPKDFSFRVAVDHALRAARGCKMTESQLIKEITRLILEVNPDVVKKCSVSPAPKKKAKKYEDNNAWV